MNLQHNTTTPFSPTLHRYHERFRTFNKHGGKFRVAIRNVCNLDCFFCHNEAMPNPRRGESASTRLDDDAILGIINTYTGMGGWQVNLTGGEPLAHPRLFALLERIEKRQTRFALNTNALLAKRLLRRPKHPVIDVILASLHTTDDATFREQLGGGSARQVMENVVALREHGYAIELNYSLGPYNRDAFPEVLAFAVQNRLALKAIAFVRPNDRPGFYGGDWVDPDWLTDLLTSRGARRTGERQAFGGYTTTWVIGGTQVKIKNVARGRLETDFCTGCSHRDRCGEGVYGVRVGVDGVWKPCLLRKDRFSPVSDEPWTLQILRIIDAMVGDWSNAHYRGGAPT